MPSFEFPPLDLGLVVHLGNRLLIPQHLINH